MKKYRIALDNSKNIFDELPIIIAISPLQAARKYAGKVVRHTAKLGGDIVVASTQFPFRMYIYDREVKQ